jgi:hypothetical protein
MHSMTLSRLTSFCFVAASIFASGVFAADAWQPRSNAGAPTARYGQTTVWTGTEVIVWGGKTTDGPTAVTFGDGGRYNPATDTWTALPSSGAPSPRGEHTAVWTGTEMIIWGGVDNTGGVLGAIFGNGARYNPTTDTWTPVETAGAPSRRAYHAAAWTGSQMVIWGGYNGVKINDGAIYTPATGSWTEMSTLNAPFPRIAFASEWTGSELIIWGGSDDSGHNRNDGARYNVAANAWTTLPTLGALSARSNHRSVWTGTEMIIWGGDGPFFNDGVRYNPISDTWTPIHSLNAPSPRSHHTAVWSGSEMIVWGGVNNSSTLGDGARYNPLTDSWLPMTSVNAPSIRMLHTAAWTGNEMVIWGGTGTKFLGAPVDLRGDTFSYTVSPTDDPYQFHTIAGLAGNTGNVDATGSNARFNLPWGVAVDLFGNAYVTDQNNNTIRKITPSGVVSTLAGGSFGSVDGVGNAASFSNLGEIAIDSAGNLYVADASNHTIRKCTPSGNVTTFAGLAGAEGSADGPANQARFSFPLAVAVDSADNVYVGEYGNCTVRKITPAGNVTTLAGLAQNPGSADGTGSLARFRSPHGLAVDNAGNLYLADSQNTSEGNNTIRKISPLGEVTTIAGLAGISGSNDGSATTARFFVPYDVAVDATGNIFVADEANHTIRKIAPNGAVTTIGGLAGVEGASDGPGTSARFRLPTAIAVDHLGKIYVTDQNHILRVGAKTAPPTAVAGPDQNIRAGTTVVLDGSASFDDDTGATDLTYAWSFSARPPGSVATLSGATTASPAFVADVVGLYEIQLVVTDSAGLSSAPDLVLCSTANLAPTAIPTVDSSLVIVGQTAHLSGLTSTDPEMDSLSYLWTATARPAGSAVALTNPDNPTQSLTPDVAGTYQLTLVVSDFLGAGAPATIQVTAITAASFAELKIIEASALVASLPRSDVQAPGLQDKFIREYLESAATALQTNGLASARSILQSAIIRTDGCVLRGQPDNGNGMDWITECGAQSTVYALLIAAINALAP